MTLGYNEAIFGSTQNHIIALGIFSRLSSKHELNEDVINPTCNYHEFQLSLDTLKGIKQTDILSFNV